MERRKHQYRYDKWHCNRGRQQIAALDQRIRQVQLAVQQQGQMLQQHSQMLQAQSQMLQQLSQLLNARLPTNGVGAGCQAMAIVLSREHNARSSRWVPVVNSAGMAPSPAPTSGSHLNRLNVPALDQLLLHYGANVQGTRSAKQQTVIALLAKG